MLILNPPRSPRGCYFQLLSDAFMMVEQLLCWTMAYPTLEYRNPRRCFHHSTCLPNPSWCGFGWPTQKTNKTNPRVILITQHSVALPFHLEIGQGIFHSIGTAKVSMICTTVMSLRRLFSNNRGHKNTKCLTPRVIFGTLETLTKQWCGTHHFDCKIFTGTLEDLKWPTQKTSGNRRPFATKTRLPTFQKRKNRRPEYILICWFG